jgi:chromosome segregation ATPase
MATNDDAKELKSIVDTFKESTKEINNSLKNTASLVGESINPFKEILNISEQLNAHKSKENQLSSDQLKLLSEKLKKEKENLLEADKALDKRFQYLSKEEKKLQDILKNNRGNSKAYKDASKALQDVQNEINANTKAQANLYDQIESTNKEVEGLENSLKKAAQATKGFETLNKVGGALDKVNTPLEGMLNPHESNK